MNSEKNLAKVIEEIKKQNFKSEDELNDYINNLIGKTLDDFPKSTDKKSRSKDLVFEAYEQTITKGKKLVKQALELDPNNVEAYNYLASVEKDIDKAIILLEKAIKVGEETLGKKFFKEEKGYFWGLIETRPYMRAKASLADCLYAKNNLDKAIEIYQEILELNPNDNQGIRYLLSTLFLSRNDLAKYEKFVAQTEDENCAVWNFNNALYSFKKLGQTKKSEKILLKAVKNNETVIDYMLGNKKMPNKQPRYISIGDENEAISYVYNAWPIWNNTEGAFDWLYKFKKNRLKIN